MATDRLVKLKHKYRIQVNYEIPAVDVVAPGGVPPGIKNLEAVSGFVRNINVDEITDGRILVSRIPEQGRLGYNAGVEETSAELKDRPVAGKHSQYMFSPLNPMTSDRFGGISLWATDDIATKPRTVVSVTAPDRDHVMPSPSAESWCTVNG